MFKKMLSKVNWWFRNSIAESLGKSPEMMAAKTEAQIMKAEEDFEKTRSHSKIEKTREGV
jgi:hypothetical protein